jgi:hypothetical protein
MFRPLQLLCPLVFCGLFGFCGLLTGAQSQTTAANAHPSEIVGGNAAVVTFSLDFPHSEPEHYSIRIVSQGPSHYESNGRISTDSDGGSDVTDNFDFDFTLSAETQARIFALAAKARYFQRDLDAHRKGVAFTGKKALSYKDAQRAGESSFNYSSDPAAQELTTLFQNLSATLEFGHRLDYDRRYQKLALVQELKRMQEMVHENLLAEVGAIRPILEQIVGDPSLVNVARARAQQLLAGGAGR